MARGDARNGNGRERCYLAMNKGDVAGSAVSGPVAACECQGMVRSRERGALAGLLTRTILFPC